MLKVLSSALEPLCSLPPLSPEVVQSQRQHPGRNRRDAGGAALPVHPGDSVRLEAGWGRLCPLAGSQRGRDQRGHAAVQHRCCKLTELHMLLLLFSLARMRRDVWGGGAFVLL